MAYFLGRDVKVCVTTENTTYGIDLNTGAVALDDSIAAGAADAIPDLNVSAPLVSNSMSDITGLDITIGATDEDVAYLGQRTALKAEIKKESTVSITRKKTSSLWSDLWTRGYRYGTTTNNGNTFRTMSNQTQPLANSGYGFRCHVMLQSAKEVITFAAMTYSNYTTTLNADGITEETIEFMTHVDPYVDGDATDGNSDDTGSGVFANF
jgi:hypothetical protein